MRAHKYAQKYLLKLPLRRINGFFCRKVGNTDTDIYVGEDEGILLRQQIMIASCSKVG